VEDSKHGIAFTTERVVCSLADIMSNFEHVPGGAAEHANFFEAGGAMSELEISRGLLHIALGVQYLHTVQRKLHLNITPENIVITATGQWKLCGFGFALAFIQGDQQRLASPYFLQACPGSTIALVSRLEPDLRYAAPEVTDGGLNPPGVRYLTPVADVFSMGLTFYEIFRYVLNFPIARYPCRSVVCCGINTSVQCPACVAHSLTVAHILRCLAVGTVSS
jgi:SCY1-like protein 2